MTVTQAAPGTKKKPIWERHRRLAIVVAVLVIVLITVLTDLPTPTTRASDVAAERSVMTEVNADLQPCAYAIHQALSLWALQAAHRLTAAERAPTPGLLTDDQSACSFTNQGINDLATNIQTPGTAAGNALGNVIAAAMLWTTSDALRAIEDVQTLMGRPGNATLRDLAKAETQLASDRRTAVAEENAADRDLDTRLQPVDLPPVPATVTPSTTASASRT